MRKWRGEELEMKGKGWFQTGSPKNIPRRLKPMLTLALLTARLNSLVKKARFVTDSAETIPQRLKAVLMPLPLRHE
jgi:hypothetical protein